MLFNSMGTALVEGTHFRRKSVVLFEIPIGIHLVLVMFSSYIDKKYTHTHTNMSLEN